MQTHPTDYSRRRIWQMGIGLLLTSCCLWGGVLWLFPWGTWGANRVERVRGNVELLAPAQWSLAGLVSLSPDGRFMVLQRTINQNNEAIVWNMHTRQLWVLPIHLTEVRWISSTQFLAYSTHNLQYQVVDVTTTNITVLPSIDTRQLPNTTWRSHVRAQWQQAEALYMMVRFGMAGYTILTQESGQYYVYWSFPGTDADVENLLEGFEYHFLSAYARPIVQLTNDQLPSPHQPWYVTREVWNVNERVAIYSTEGRLLAEAYKPGWDPYVLGWSHDGGSVYIQFRRSGAAVAVLQPAAPVFKLSPLTPVEAFWQWIQWISLVVMVLVGLCDPFIQRRRHKRETSS